MFHAEAELFAEPLIDYLRSRGWALMESEPDIAVLRKLFDGQEEELVLPKDRSYSDYHQRVMEAVQSLARYEQSSERSIIEELLVQKWDVLRIRISGDRIGAGNISYLDKGVIEEGIRKVLFASARYVLDPQVHFKRLYSNTVEQWLKKCRAGLAESGSYILTVQMPLEKNLDVFEPPFSRKVGEYLMRSLGHLVGFSGQLHLVENHRLNANLCHGLVEMKPDDTVTNFDFEMKWSSMVTQSADIPSKVEVRDHHFSSIMQIGQRLIPQSKENHNVFIGKVLVLHGEANESGQMQGEATLILLMDEQQVKAKVTFGPERYPLVCDAHKSNKYIRISGILTEKPRCSELRNISDLEIIN